MTPILMYHEIGDPRTVPDEDAATWTLTPARFAEHLAALADAGLTGVSVWQWLERRSRGAETDGCVVITFDDGYRGNVDNAIPALCERGWSATFFVISGAMGRAGYAEPADWAAAGAAGMDIASHTATHPYLGALAEAEARREMLDSRLALESAISAPVCGISWPNGDGPRHAEALLAECGYRWAATSWPGFAGPRTDERALPRLAVRSWHDAPALARLIDRRPANRLRLGATGSAKRLARALLGRNRYAALHARRHAVSGEG